MGCFIVAIVETIKTIMTEYFNFFSKTFIQIKTIRFCVTLQTPFYTICLSLYKYH